MVVRRDVIPAEGAFVQPWVGAAERVGAMGGLRPRPGRPWSGAHVARQAGHRIVLPVPLRPAAVRLVSEACDG